MAKKGKKSETEEVVKSAEQALDSNEIVENAIEERDEADETTDSVKSSNTENVNEKVNEDDGESKPTKKGRKKKEIEIKTKQKSKSNKKIRSKVYRESRDEFRKKDSYSVTDAVKLIKDLPPKNFNESVEVHINLGTDPKNSDQRIRFTTSLPFGIGKSVKILVITDNDKTVKQLNDEAKDNVIVRDKSVVEEILGNKLSAGKDFDVVITNPSMMKDLGKIAKVLGPKGMMPSLKNNTITDNVSKAIDEFAKGQVEVKSQPGHSVIHQIVGTKSFEANQIVENVQSLIDEINKHSPSKLKKKLIQSVYLCTTMSPSIKVNA